MTPMGRLALSGVAAVGSWVQDEASTGVITGFDSYRYRHQVVLYHHETGMHLCRWKELERSNLQKIDTPDQDFLDSLFIPESPDFG